MVRKLRSASVLYAAAVLGVLSAVAQAPSTVTGPHWVASWATSVQGAEPENNQPPVDSAKLADATIRQVVHLSAGGTALRVVFSNAFGTQPLVIEAAGVALPAGTGAAIVPGSARPITFAGRASVTIPIGASYISDPVG